MTGNKDFTCTPSTNSFEMKTANAQYGLLMPWETMMADFSQTRILGKVGGQFLHARWWLHSPIRMRTPYCILDRRRFGMRMIGMLLALSASCVLPLRLHASLPRTYDWVVFFFTDERQLEDYTLRTDVFCVCFDDLLRANEDLFVTV